jgi:hypothetical protein
MSTINPMSDVLSKLYGGSGSASNDFSFLNGMKTASGAAADAYKTYELQKKVAGEEDEDVTGDTVSTAESTNSAGVYSKKYVPYVGAGKYQTASAPGTYSGGKTIPYTGDAKYGVSYANGYLENLNKPAETDSSGTTAATTSSTTAATSDSTEEDTVPYIGGAKYGTSSSPAAYSGGKTVPYTGDAKYGASYADDYIDNLKKSLEGA